MTPEKKKQLQESLRLEAGQTLQALVDAYKGQETGLAKVATVWTDVDGDVFKVECEVEE